MLWIAEKKVPYQIGYINVTSPLWDNAVIPISAIKRITIGNIWNFFLTENSENSSFIVESLDIMRQIRFILYALGSIYNSKKKYYSNFNSYVSSGNIFLDLSKESFKRKLNFSRKSFIWWFFGLMFTEKVLEEFFSITCWKTASLIK